MDQRSNSVLFFRCNDLVTEDWLLSHIDFRLSKLSLHSKDNSQKNTNKNEITEKCCKAID